MAATPLPAAAVPRVRRQPSLAAHRDAAVRSSAAAILWLGLLLVVWTWVVDRGVQDLGGWETGLTSLGRLTGLTAAVLLLAQVLLMARVPALERSYGRERLVRIHRVVGFTSFDLLVAHVVLITWGYAAGRLSQTPAMFWDLTWHYPGMLLAVAGTAALVMVVVTSVRVARRRLRYESWHLLHLYGYLGAGLALPHQLWTGQEFLRMPVLTALWWTAWGLTAATVLVCRLALPLWRSAQHRIRVAGVVAEAPGVLSVHLTGRGLDRLAAPGQFLVWRFLDRPGWTRANPYSVSAAPRPDALRITVRAVGEGSGGLAGLRPGTRAVVEGAYGRLGERARTRPKIALIGAGVGLAPLRSLAEGLAYAPGDAILLERYREHPLFAAELDRLAKMRGLGVVRLPGRRRQHGSWVGRGYRQYDDVQVLLGWVPDIADRDVFVCGPPDWTDSVRRTALAAGVPAEQLHVEAFGW